MGRKSGSKRQASLDARKQILKVRGDFLELSEDDEDDEVVEITEAPAKKYKVTARKSDGERNVLRIVRLDAEQTLELEVWSDDLSPAQLMARKLSQSARDSIHTIVNDVVKENDGRLITNTTHLTALELNNFIQTENAKKAALANAVPTVARPGPGRPPGMRRIVPGALPPKPGLSVFLEQKAAKAAAVVAAAATLANNAAAPGAAQATTQPVRRIEAPVPKKKAFLKGYTAPTTTTTPIPGPPAMIPIIRTEVTTAPQPAAAAAAVAIAPRPATVVDLTSDDATKTGTSADTKEVAFNKLQGKTFPSLVVVARPSLCISESGNQNQNRAALDRKVKRLLILAPSQFAEYLIQQGLVKSEHYCQTHPHVKLKLGMYSDAARFPNSGGYIWISECCPPKFLSVFHESLFEGSQLPSTNFKLIYHWACQTNVQNVLQWVKVENIYLKGLYTWLRGICTVALHTHFPTLGGLGCAVEVGVISLGTTTHDGANRHVKVEVLGVLETQTKRLMLRAVDPNDAEIGKSAKKRFSKILEPLLDWVNPESTLVIDMTIEKQAMHAMGFKNIARNGTNGASNQTIMDYLRRIVPRMFQNTLSLLSRQIIQQFLDELVWREMYGTTAYDAFHSIQKHISEQTRVSSGTSFFTRLNKVAANPFKRWSIQEYLKKPPIRPKPKQYGSAPGLQPSLSANSQMLQQVCKVAIPRVLNNALGTPRVAQIPKQLTSLESYYYGTVECDPVVEEVELNVKCPICQKVYGTNTDLMLHLFRHVATADYFCKYCLMDCGSKHNLYTHLELKHAIETKAGRFFNCLICHDKFNSVVVLGKHMSIEHSPSELPYHCGSCEYKSSSHKAIIDHFYKKHRKQAILQCPFCLSITKMEENMTADANTFLQHLIAHAKKGKNPKGAVKKCARCDLQFLDKEEFDQHGERHICYKNEPNFKPYPDAKNAYMVPKSLRDDELKETKQNRPEPQVQQCSVTFSIPEDYKCKECGKFISVESHFKDIMFCMKADCKYQTMCKTAMMSHKVLCNLYSKKVQEHPLDFELFCVCGFSSSDGNEMAGHLAICERKSAYPSAEAASKASITPGMLDVLGLIRKDESKDPEDIKPKKTRPEPRRRKRKWRLSDVSDNEEDADDPDYSTSDEDFRVMTKKRRKQTITVKPPILEDSVNSAAADKTAEIVENEGDAEQNEAMEESHEDKEDETEENDIENEADGGDDTEAVEMNDNDDKADDAAAAVDT